MLLIWTGRLVRRRLLRPKLANRAEGIYCHTLKHPARRNLMRILFVHPSPLMYSEIYLRLEPLGMERVAAATRAAGHDVRIIDLQIFKHRDLFAELESFKPNAVAFSLNYLANVPEVIDLAKDVKRVMKECFVFTGGHSGSFVAGEIFEHVEGASDAGIRGEGETATPMPLR